MLTHTPTMWATHSVLLNKLVKQLVARKQKVGFLSSVPTCGDWLGVAALDEPCHGLLMLLGLQPQTISTLLAKPRQVYAVRHVS